MWVQGSLGRDHLNGMKRHLLQLPGDWLNTDDVQSAAKVRCKPDRVESVSGLAILCKGKLPHIYLNVSINGSYAILLVRKSIYRIISCINYILTMNICKHCLNIAEIAWEYHTCVFFSAYQWLQTHLSSCLLSPSCRSVYSGLLVGIRVEGRRIELHYRVFFADLP